MHTPILRSYGPGWHVGTILISGNVISLLMAAILSEDLDNAEVSSIQSGSSEDLMTKNFPQSGKRNRPKTAVKGKRFRCAKCHKRSPKPVTTPAPWYCANCLKDL